MTFTFYTQLEDTIEELEDIIIFKELFSLILICIFIFQNKNISFIK